MKIRYFVLISFIFLFETAYTQLKGDTYAAAQKSKKANVVYTYAESPGIIKIDPDGVTGICVDIMKAFEGYVKEQKGITLSVSYQSADPYNFTKFLDQVKQSSGGVFGLSNTSIIDSRKSTYTFSPPYINNTKMILSNGVVETINSLDEISSVFSGLTAVTVKNSTNERRLLAIKEKYFPNMKMEYEISSDAVLDRLARDENTFSSLDVVYFLTAQRNKQPVKRHNISDSEMEGYGIIMPKDSDWGPLLTQFINEFVGGSEYRDIIIKHLGPASLKFFGVSKD